MKPSQWRDHAEYLSVALENPDPNAFLDAVRDVSKAQGISTVAANAGIGRKSLYKALKPEGKTTTWSVWTNNPAVGSREYIEQNLDKFGKSEDKNA